MAPGNVFREAVQALPPDSGEYAVASHDKRSKRFAARFREFWSRPRATPPIPAPAAGVRPPPRAAHTPCSLAVLPPTHPAWRQDPHPLPSPPHTSSPSLRPPPGHQSVSYPSAAARGPT